MTGGDVLAENAALRTEVQRLTHLMGSHADGHLCTCTMTRGATWETPAEWEQDPWCHTHPDMNVVAAEMERYREYIANSVDRCADAAMLTGMLNRSRQTVAEQDAIIARVTKELAEARMVPHEGTIYHGLRDGYRCATCIAAKADIQAGQA